MYYLRVRDRVRGVPILMRALMMFVVASFVSLFVPWSSNTVWSNLGYDTAHTQTNTISAAFITQSEQGSALQHLNRTIMKSTITPAVVAIAALLLLGTLVSPLALLVAVGGLLAIGLMLVMRTPRRTRSTTFSVTIGAT